MKTAMSTRVMTALVLGAGMLAVVLLLPPIATVLVLTIGVLAGAWEWSAFLRATGKLARGAYVALIAALLVVAWRCTADRAARDLVGTVETANTSADQSAIGWPWHG